MLRSEMEMRSQIDAFILTSYDEHQNYEPDDMEGRLQFISGFSGPFAYVVVSRQSWNIKLSLLKEIYF